jgi:hypothetical protein
MNLFGTPSDYPKIMIARKYWSKLRISNLTPPQSLALEPTD